MKIRSNHYFINLWFLSLILISPIFISCIANYIVGYCLSDSHCEHGQRCDTHENNCIGISFMLNKFLTFIWIYVMFKTMIFDFLPTNISFSSLEKESWAQIFGHKSKTADEEIGSKSCMFDFDCEHGHRCDKLSNTCQGMSFLL